ncbi:aminotransferase class V-fold PLP-dependent enzyme [Salinithrix halophila]|uniref:cysteine desulfurase n=1 Tax=Salinithrix halophila TaxID=1485204 RepID=A0ABV8JH53_9BACL
MIYLDNAATTWPKPPGVAKAMKRMVEDLGANPGRGGHRMAREASGVVEETRRLLARFFHAEDPKHVFFCHNGTHAVNQALKGWLSRGDHVITTSWEHHAVARPLEYLKREAGIEVTRIFPGERGSIDLDQLEAAIRPSTRLIAITHASNVTGAVIPVKEVAEIARRHGVPSLVDAAQTAGILPIDVQEWGIDLLAFPGHKGLFGPQGTGGLYVSPEFPLKPLFQGGTGSKSEELEHPVTRPEGFESGTLNTPGIAGLGEGIRFLEGTGLESIHQREMVHAEAIRSGLESMERVRLYPPLRFELPVLSFNIEGIESTEAAVLLDQHFEIAVRGGYHCAALAHRTNETAGSGTLRVSPGYYNTDKEIQTFLQAVDEIAGAFSGW